MMNLLPGASNQLFSLNWPMLMGSFIVKGLTPGRYYKDTNKCSLCRHEKKYFKCSQYWIWPSVISCSEKRKLWERRAGLGERAKRWPHQSVAVLSLSSCRQVTLLCCLTTGQNVQVTRLAVLCGRTAKISMLSPEQKVIGNLTCYRSGFLS